MILTSFSFEIICNSLIKIKPFTSLNIQTLPKATLRTLSEVLVLIWNIWTEFIRTFWKKKMYLNSFRNTRHICFENNVGVLNWYWHELVVEMHELSVQYWTHHCKQKYRRKLEFCRQDTKEATICVGNKYRLIHLTNFYQINHNHYNIHTLV